MGNCVCYNRGKEATPLLSVNWESFQAAKRGDLEGLKNRLKVAGTKTFHEIDEEDQNVLHFAANGGHLNCVSWLIEDCKFQVNQADRQGWTPLHHAAFNGHVSVISYLIRSDADVFAKDRRGNQAHHIAAEAGQLEVLRELLQKKTEKGKQLSN